MSEEHIFNTEVRLMQEVQDVAKTLVELFKLRTAIAFKARYASSSGRVQHNLFHTDVLNALEEMAKKGQSSGGLLGRWM